MRYTTATFLVAALSATTTAHMNMMDPPPLNYKGNPHVVSADIDYSITTPNSNATFPCKGALSAFSGTGGTPVATWAPGSQQTIKIEGGAAHNGGSCQASLSYDSGKTFTVIYSKIGGCPTTPSMTFTLPSDTPTGDKVLFAWSWFNNEGNREFYMNCASLTIAGSSTKKREVAEKRGSTVAFANRPALYVANLDQVAGQPCSGANKDLIFPDPGPDFDNVTTMGLGPVDCESHALLTGGGTSGSGTGSGSSGSAASFVGTPKATTATAVAVTSSVAASSVSITGGVFVTTPGSASTAARTTLTTSVALVGTGSGSASSSSSAVVVASRTTSASRPIGTGTQSGGGSSLSGVCDSEGSWNCLTGGTSFQRCASGAWSAVMPMAAGTSCSPGISDNLSTNKRRRGGVVRRGASAWEW